MTKSIRLFAAALALPLALAGCAGTEDGPKTAAVQRQEVPMQASLAGSSEVPPVSTTARGDAKLNLDRSNNMLSWRVTYTGLSGPATGAHLHGPAPVGANAGVQINIATGGLQSPLEGSAKLTEAQVADLMAGRIYVNVHTAANPNGEVRGQVVRAN